MSLVRMGLGGELIFDSNRAVTAMFGAGRASQALAQAQASIAPSADRAGRAVDSLGSRSAGSASKVSAAASQISGAVGKIGGIASSLGIALAPLAAGFGFGVKQAADFEQQMSAVAAVSLASKEEMADLELKAKQLGASTVFTATQAGEAMENLSRAGASTKEVLSGIDGVLAAAAADSIPLATSADIVAKVIRGLGLEFSEANRVADVLALTSAKTNTDMIGLGEAFKYGASQSRVMGVDLETTSMLLGLVADAGLRGSIGGTSYASMLRKLSKPSEDANAWLKANRIEWTKTAEGGLDAIAVIDQIRIAVAKETDVMKKSAIVSELFGDRGQKAFSAIEAGMEKGKHSTLLRQLYEAEGTAAEMARRRLDNMKGAWTLFMSAVEGFAIETAGQFLKPLTSTITSLSTHLNKVTQVLQKLNAGVTDTGELNKEYGKGYVAVAMGIKEGLETVIEVYEEVKRQVSSIIQAMTGETDVDMTKMIAKWVTMFVTVAAMSVPLLFAIAGIASFITSVVIPVAEQLINVIGGIVSIATGWGLVIAGIFLIIRNDGESVGETLMRIWHGVGDAINWVIDNAVMPFVTSLINTITPAWEYIKGPAIAFFNKVRDTAREVVGGIIQAFKFLTPFFRGLFKILGSIIGYFADGVILVFRGIMAILSPVIDAVKALAIWIVEGVVNGILSLVRGLITVADAVGKGDWIPKEFRDFAKQPEFKITNATQTFADIGVRPKVIEKGIDPNDLPDVKAEKEATRAKPANVQVDLELEDNRKLDVKTCTTIDGREVALAQGRAQQEIHERNGFKATPWQRRAVAEQGAVPVGGLGGK